MFTSTTSSVIATSYLSEDDAMKGAEADVYKRQVKDLLASREIENIFENSDFVYLLNQASGDRQILSKALVSPMTPYFTVF